MKNIKTEYDIRKGFRTPSEIRSKKNNIGDEVLVVGLVMYMWFSLLRDAYILVLMDDNSSIRVDIGKNKLNLMSGDKVWVKGKITLFENLLCVKADAIRTNNW